MTIRIDQSQVHALRRGSDDIVGNSPGVHWELTESIGSLPGWHKGVRQKKIETYRKIIEGLDDAEGARREFARRFTKGIGKLARNTPKNRWRKTVRLAAIESGGCRIAGVRS
ncbi:hypothetical protein B296_00032052 [Ensete ventricosum]|uniref:Uncharacterized protein n=1 Tax=Ensete ventricosum TaxID=4639 RepID=A0A426Y392_ENSVE|nr:hypothetical protein B296_00032052 [Ensete ventricosum]